MASRRHVAISMFKDFVERVELELPNVANSERQRNVNAIWHSAGATAFDMCTCRL